MARQGYGNVEGEYIKCPIWKSYAPTEIRCESHVPECSACILKYRTADACEKQRKLFCEENWERCEHYIAWKHMRWED